MQLDQNSRYHALQTWFLFLAESVYLSVYLLPVEETVNTQSVKYCAADPM